MVKSSPSTERGPVKSEVVDVVDGAESAINGHHDRAELRNDARASQAPALVTLAASALRFCTVPMGVESGPDSAAIFIAAGSAIGWLSPRSATDAARHAAPTPSRGGEVLRGPRRPRDGSMAHKSGAFERVSSCAARPPVQFCGMAWIVEESPRRRPACAEPGWAASRELDLPERGHLDGGLDPIACCEGASMKRIIITSPRRAAVVGSAPMMRANRPTDPPGSTSTLAFRCRERKFRCEQTAAPRKLMAVCAETVDDASISVTDPDVRRPTRVARTITLHSENTSQAGGGAARRTLIG